MDSKLFIFGGCDLHDVVDIGILRRDFTVVDPKTTRKNFRDETTYFSEMRFPDMGTSLISMYTRLGPIAQRILETQHVDRETNKHVLDEILKFPYLDFYKKHAGPNDFLLLGFGPELYTKCVNGQECFSILPGMFVLENPHNPLHWIFKEYFTKEDLLLAFDTKESLEWTFDLMVDFARDIYEIFEDRVVLVKTHFSNFILEQNAVEKILVGPSSIPFYKQSKIVTDPTDHNYADRLSTIIMNKFRHHYKADIDLIRLDQPVFLDGNHRWGLSQFHIDRKSRAKLAELVHNNLMSKIAMKQTTGILDV